VDVDRSNRYALAAVPGLLLAAVTSAGAVVELSTARVEKVMDFMLDEFFVIRPTSGMMKPKLSA
jgi:hypothetical protein